MFKALFFGAALACFYGLIAFAIVVTINLLIAKGII